MEETNIFLGNEICCGTYAFLNTVQDREINGKLFEITSTVPFGIRHRKENDYSRLLTTYCDPNIGIDRAAKLWGYDQNKKVFKETEESVEYILKKSKTDRCLVGPLDMKRLTYLILPNLYANMDHYITVFDNNGELFCMDSEGLPARRVSVEELREWLKVGELPEAKGQIAVRCYERIEDALQIVREESALRNSMELIIKNLSDARKEGQGNFAIEKCFYWLKEQPVERWQMSFLYDISFLIQRKMLQHNWIKLVEEFHLLNEDSAQEIEKILEKQIHVLGNIFCILQCDHEICDQHFKELAESEENLSIKIEKASKES